MVSVLFLYADDSSVMFGFFFLHVFYVLKIISLFIVVHLIFYLLFILFISRERGREGERGRETSVGGLLYVPQPGTKPATQAHAPTGNQIGDLWLCRTVPHQLKHTRQGWFCHSYLRLACVCVLQ